MFRLLSLCAVCLAGLCHASAQPLEVENDIITLTVPSEYAFVTESTGPFNAEVMEFSAPADRDKVEEMLSAFNSRLSLATYIEEIADYLGDDEEENAEALRSVKSLKVSLIDIVPDDEFDPTRSQIPVSDVGGISDVCETFFVGFENRWGAGAFYVYDKNKQVCHFTNVYGAVIAIHVTVKNDTLIIIEAIDWSFALMPDLLSSDELQETKAWSEVFGFADFETATSKQKFKFYREAANTDDVLELLESIRLVTE